MSLIVRRLAYHPRPSIIHSVSSPYSSLSLNQSFGDKVIASKNTSGVKRDPSVINRVKRGSQKVSIKSMVLLLVGTNVVLAGLVYLRKQKEKEMAQNNQDSA